MPEQYVDFIHSLCYSLSRCDIRILRVAHRETQTHRPTHGTESEIWSIANGEDGHRISVRPLTTPHGSHR